MYTEWRGSMTIEQLNMLERTFMTFTPKGWVAAKWIASLRHKILWWEFEQSRKGDKHATHSA